MGERLLYKYARIASGIGLDFDPRTVQMERGLDHVSRGGSALRSRAIDVDVIVAMAAAEQTSQSGQAEQADPSEVVVVIILIARVGVVWIRAGSSRARVNSRTGSAATTSCTRSLGRWVSGAATGIGLRERRR